MTTRPRISENSLTLILSLVVGLCAGSAAVLLKWLISLFKKAASPLLDGGSVVPYLVLPAVGMLLAFLITKFVLHDNIGHGVTKVLVAVSRNESRIKPHNMWSSVLCSALTIGLGGSVGAEAPIVYTGAAFGSNIGRKAGLSARSIKILVGCGAAAAVAGIFKAPMAGVLFTLEILLFNISMSSMMPILVSTVSAVVVAYSFTGMSSPFECSLDPFAMNRIPWYLILGVVCAASSLYFQKVTLALEDLIQKRLRNHWIRWAICAVGLGLLLYLFPPLFGEGYDSLSGLLTGGAVSSDFNTPLSFMLRSDWGLPLFFLLVMLFKVLSMTLTNSGGGVGGTFGPTLVVGGFCGFVVARMLNLSLGLDLPEQNFVLVGMGGLMAGVMQAPMTAIFLIAEITGGYDLFLPLIICSTVSFGCTRCFEKYSIYSKRVAQSGDLLTHDNDQAAMALMNVDDLIRDKYPKVHKRDSLRRLVDVISSSSTAVIAVISRTGRFEGVIDMSSAHKIIFRTELYDTLTAEDIMENPPALLHRGEKAESIMAKFDRTEAWRLPVVDENGKYLGFISRSRLLGAYRQELKGITTPDA